MQMNVRTEAYRTPSIDATRIYVYTGLHSCLHLLFGRWVEGRDHPTEGIFWIH